MLALEATRDLTKVWAHVDMDAFYAAAEELANPSLVGHRHLILIRHSQEHDWQAAMAAYIQCISLGSFAASQNWSLPELCSIWHLHESFSLN